MKRLKNSLCPAILVLSLLALHLTPSISEAVTLNVKVVPYGGPPGPVTVHFDPAPPLKPEEFVSGLPPSLKREAQPETAKSVTFADPPTFTVRFDPSRSNIEIREIDPKTRQSTTSVWEHDGLREEFRSDGTRRVTEIATGHWTVYGPDGKIIASSTAPGPSDLQTGPVHTPGVPGEIREEWITKWRSEGLTVLEFLPDSERYTLPDGTWIRFYKSDGITMIRFSDDHWAEWKNGRWGYSNPTVIDRLAGLFPYWQISPPPSSPQAGQSVTQTLSADGKINFSVGNSSFSIPATLFQNIARQTGKPVEATLEISTLYSAKPGGAQTNRRSLLAPTSEIRRRDFFNSLISEIGLPAMDAGSKDAARMTVKISPEVIRYKKGSGARISGALKMEQKLWLPSNFHFSIPGLDTSRVQKLDSFTVKQSSTTPSKFESTEVKITLTEPDESWRAWLKSKDPRDATLTFSLLDNTEIARLYLNLKPEGETLPLRSRLTFSSFAYSSAVIEAAKQLSEQGADKIKEPSLRTAAESALNLYTVLTLAAGTTISDLFPYMEPAGMSKPDKLLQDAVALLTSRAAQAAAQTGGITGMPGLILPPGSPTTETWKWLRENPAKGAWVWEGPGGITIETEVGRRPDGARVETTKLPIETAGGRAELTVPKGTATAETAWKWVGEREGPVKGTWLWEGPGGITVETEIGKNPDGARVETTKLRIETASGRGDLVVPKSTATATTTQAPVTEGKFCTGGACDDSATLDCGASGCRVATQRDLCTGGTCTDGDFCSGSWCERVKIEGQTCTQSGGCNYSVVPKGDFCTDSGG